MPAAASLMRALAPIAAALVSLTAAAPPAQATTLQDAIRLAYQTNPTLRAQRAELHAVDEDYVQARAQLGPQLGLDGQGGYSIARVQSQPSLFFKGGDTTYRGLTGSGALVLQQPLFSFGGNHARLAGARDTALSGREGLREVEAEVLGKVISAYLDVRRDRATLVALDDELAALRRDVEEARARGKAGALSRTDVAEAEARLIGVESEIEQTRGRLMVSAAAYTEAVGEAPGELAPEPPLPGLPAGMDAAAEAVLADNPKVRAALLDEEAAREKVNEAKSAYGPTISMQMDAGVQPVEPYLPGLYDRNVTVAGVLHLPLVTSGMRASKVRQEADRDSEALIRIAGARREALQQLAQAWAQLTSAREAARLSARQADAERIAVEGALIEARAGVRSIFELITNEQALAAARVAELQARHDQYLAEAAVLAAMGLLSIETLAPDEPAYAPGRSLRKALRTPEAPVEQSTDGVDRLVAPRTRRPADPELQAGAALPPVIAPRNFPQE